MAAKRALVVAINDYPGTGNDLPSCVNDAKAMETLVRDEFGFQVHSLVNSDATIGKVEETLKALFKDAASDDSLLFFYSGHGYQAPKNNTMEEYLVLYDGFFQDDQLSSLTQDLPPGVLTVVFDSCFSGGMEKLFFEVAGEERARVKCWMPERNEFAETVKLERSVTSYRPFGCAPIEMDWSPNALKAFRSKDFKAADDEMGQLQMNGLLISACSEDETAAASTSATDGLSAFTFSFRKAMAKLGKSASSNDLVREADRQLKSMKFRQTPLLKEPLKPTGFGSRSFLTGKVVVSKTEPEVASGDEFAKLVAAMVTFLLRREKTMSDKGWEAAVPLAIEIVRALTKDKGFGISVGGGVSTPLGGGSFGGGISLKGWEDAVPLAIEIVRAMTKAEPPQKLFGIDDAILIPAIASVVAAAVKGQQKGSEAGEKGWEAAFPPITGLPNPAVSLEKGWETAVPLAIEIVRALTKDKGLGISVGGGVSTPLGGGSIGGGISLKGWEDAVPLAIEIVRAVTKAQTPQKLFGIDDAILIPAIASVVAAAIKR